MDLIEKYMRSIDKSLQRIADSMKKIEKDIQPAKAPLVIPGREISEEELEMWKNSTMNTFLEIPQESDDQEV